MAFGEGHDTTFPYALALATGAEYDWLMGSSGAAFTTTIDETGWDPLAAAPRDVHEQRVSRRREQTQQLRLDIDDEAAPRANWSRIPVAGDRMNHGWR